MKKKKITTFGKFRLLANKYVIKTYGSSLSELMIDDEDVQCAFDNGDTPEGYIDWMGEKYGLTKKEDFTLEKANRVMGNFIK